MKRVEYLLNRVRLFLSLGEGLSKSLSHVLALKINPKSVRLVGSRGIFFRAGDELALKEVFFSGEYDFLADYLSTLKNPLVLDLGAHIGSFAILISALNRRARVFSVEADPDTFLILEKNIVHHAKINTEFAWRSINAAMVDTDRAVSFTSMASTMSSRIDNEGQITVNGIGFDTMLEKFEIQEQIDLLKIDIEGAEALFFKSLLPHLHKIQRLVIELHPDRCETNQIVEALKSRFSTVKNISERESSKPLLYCHDR